MLGITQLIGLQIFMTRIGGRVGGGSRYRLGFDTSLRDYSTFVLLDQRRRIETTYKKEIQHDWLRQN